LESSRNGYGAHAVVADDPASGSQMTAPADESRDVITLTLPGDGRFVGVARMVVGGLASRLDLSYERLDDLQLAVETVAGGYTAGDVTIEVLVRSGAIEVLLAPLDLERITAELESPGDAMGLGVLLPRVVDAIGFEERDGVRWLRLTKQAPVKTTP
jgi:anti-sigma regulatory factor (Ser/Thr protein kinase)